MASQANMSAVAPKPATLSSSYLTLEATEQVTPPTSSSNTNTSTSNAKSPAKYTKVVEIRTDHDIRHFRRSLPKLIAAMVKPDALVPPQIDIFFKRTPPFKTSSGGIDDKSSKSGFEAKIKECLSNGYPLKVTYTIRDAGAKIKSQASKTLPTSSAFATTPSLASPNSTTKNVAVATDNGPVDEKKDPASSSTSGVTNPANSLPVAESVDGFAHYARLSREHSALMQRQLSEANEKREEAEVRLDHLKEQLNVSKSAQQATAALLEASQTHVDQLAKSLATFEKLAADKASLAGSEPLAGDKAHLQGKASSIVSGMKDFLAAYAKVSQACHLCDTTPACSNCLPFHDRLQLMGPDEQEMLPSTEDKTQQEQQQAQQSTAKPSVKAPQERGVLHPGIFCDGACDAAVRGLRWKCVACLNFDFCDCCYQTEREAHVKKLGAKHLFLAVHDPMSTSQAELACGRRRGPPRGWLASRPQVRYAQDLEEAKSSAKSSVWSTEPIAVKASAPTPTTHKPAQRRSNVSVQLLPEPVPASSELTAGEKSIITQKILDAGQGIEQKLKDLLQNQQQMPENTQHAGEFVVDVDYLTRSQFEQIMTLLDQENAKHESAKQEHAMPTQPRENPSTTPHTQETSTTQAEDDVDGEKLPYDCTLTWTAKGDIIIASNTGTSTWSKKSLHLMKSVAGSPWWNTRASIIDGEVRTKETDFVQPGEHVAIWHNVKGSWTGPNLPSRPNKDGFFRMAITYPSGKCQRFGEQLVRAGPECAAAVHEANSKPAAGATPFSSDEGKETDAAVEETASGAGKTLSGSSILTIPAAPEATHTDAEAALAASIPSRPSSREREDEGNGPVGHSVEARKLSSQHTGQTEESAGDALRSPSYEGGSTNSERDPFDSFTDEEEVFLDDQDEDEDTFIVIDAGTDEESVVGV